MIPVPIIHKIETFFDSQTARVYSGPIYGPALHYRMVDSDPTRLEVVE